MKRSLKKITWWLGGGAGACSFVELALVILPLTTHPFRDGAPFLLPVLGGEGIVELTCYFMRTCRTPVTDLCIEADEEKEPISAIN